MKALKASAADTEPPYQRSGVPMPTHRRSRLETAMLPAAEEVPITASVLQAVRSMHYNGCGRRLPGDYSAARPP